MSGCLDWLSGQDKAFRQASWSRWEKVGPRQSALDRPRLPPSAWRVTMPKVASSSAMACEDMPRTFMSASNGAIGSKFEQFNRFHAITA